MNEFRRWTLGALAPLLAITCSSATGPEISFELAEARWTAERPSHYQYVYDVSCECLVIGPVRLNVENGVVTAFTLLPGSFPAGGAPEAAAFPTIDDLFARLRAEAGADPVQFDVEYDGELRLSDARLGRRAGRNRRRRVHVPGDGFRASGAARGVAGRNLRFDRSM